MSRPNVLLLVMDSVRAHNCSLHGYGRETTPFLDAFADGATTYAQARAPGRWSLPSHASLFTGYHVAEHGLNDEGRRLAPGHSVFEELRDDRGYETGLFSYNGYINGRVETGLDRGFDTVEGYRDPLFSDAANPAGLRGQKREFLRRCLADDQPVRSALNGLVMKLGWDYPGLLPDWVRRETIAGPTPDDVYVDLFLDWQAETDGPWAACLNFMETHNAYEPDPEHNLFEEPGASELQDDLAYGNWEYLSGQRPTDELGLLASLYDGTIHQVDAHVERIVTALAERGALEDTLVVVTGDHGEGFGEPSRTRPDLPVVQHVVDAHEVLLHVPLVVKYPGQTESRRVAAPATLTRFPGVVREVLDGATAGGPPAGEPSFVPDGPVVASCHGLNEVNREKMRAFCDEADYWQFEGVTRVRYEAGADGGVAKQMTWQDRRVALTVGADGTATDERRGEAAADAAAAVEATFDDLADRDVIEGADGEVDETTERLLEDLGYR